MSSKRYSTVCAWVAWGYSFTTRFQISSVPVALAAFSRTASVYFNPDSPVTTGSFNLEADSI